MRALNTHTSATPNPDRAAAVTNQLFDELSAIYPNFKYIFETRDQVELMKKTWVTGLRENGIHTIAQVRQGLKKARQDTNKYPPTIGIFIHWCKPNPADYGLPDYRTAYLEACHHRNGQRWSHAAVYQATMEVGYFELRSRTEQEVLPRFKAVYDALCQRVANGETLTIPTIQPERTITRVRKNCSKETGNRFLQQMREGMYS